VLFAYCKVTQCNFNQKFILLSGHEVNPKYVNRYHHIDPYERKENCTIFHHIFQRWLGAKMVIFTLSLILKKLNTEVI